MIVALTRDRRLVMRDNVVHWKLVPDSGKVRSVTVLPNGTLLALLEDSNLYTRATLTSAWLKVPELADDVRPMRSVAALPTGGFVAAGAGQGYLYYKPDFNKYWTMIDTEEDVSLSSVMAGASGKIYGTDTDALIVYERDGVNGDWKAVTGGQAFDTVTELPDGTLIGVDAAGKKLKALSLAREWKDVPGLEDLPVRDINVLPDGTFLGVGEDSQLYTRPRIPSTGWRPMNLGEKMKSVTVLDDGTLVGLNPTGGLLRYTGRSDYALDPWESMNYFNSLLSVAVFPDALIGVGTDLFVHDIRAATDWPDSYGVSCVTRLANSGRTIGIRAGTKGGKFDGQLCEWTEVTSGHAWNNVDVERDIPVTAVTALYDGLLVGVGASDHMLYTKDVSGFPTRWNLVPGSGPVTSVSALPDGSLLGIGLDGQAYVWPDFLAPSPWRAVQIPADLENLAFGTVTSNPPGTIFGILDQKNDLYSINLGTGDWSKFRHIDLPLIGVTSMKNPSRLICVVPTERTDLNLISRSKNPNGVGYTKIASNLAVKSVTTALDGTLLGVGYGDDNSLYWSNATSLSLNVPEPSVVWRQVPDSAAVISATVLPDDTILAVGTNLKLYTRTALFGGSWHMVPDAGTVQENLELVAVTVLPGDLPPVQTSLTVSTRPADWLLDFTELTPLQGAGDGRPWGDGTAMARRFATPEEVPWDTGCRVTPMVNGFVTFAAIRDSFEAAIEDATRQGSEQTRPPGERGHVCITDWLLNGLRDLSDTNPWHGEKWDVETETAVKDQTALGLILRMMSAGITVRIMLWLPTPGQQSAGGLSQHAKEHWNLAAAIQDHNDALQKDLKLKDPLGVVALDTRTACTGNATPSTASLHQKMIAVRVGSVNVGFCGGVDLAFTRRDFGSYGRSGAGDWQSGSNSPPRAAGWPKQVSVPPLHYPAYPYDPADSTNAATFPEDLPANVYGPNNRHWHDQHLKLEGPVVASLEDQFAERWIINAGKVSPFKRESDFPSVNEVTVTSAQAIKGGQMAPLEPSVPVAPAGDATVQVWRTIPVYPGRDKTTGPFRRGEFTIMAGVAKAVAQARHLITIWDQYFWSAPLARLLANQLNTTPTLRLLIVLPPYGTGHPKEELGLRKYAVEELYGHLTAEARSRVMMRNMWDHDSDIGIYVHDKVQTYDDALLVCGSANMNRRSFECDAELDCAVLHAPTVRSHLARLYASLAGESWVDFGPGWLGRYWESFGYGGIIDQVFYSKWLIKDPFFQPPEADIPPLPNGLKITTRDALKEQWRWVLDPSGFKADLESVGGEPDINQVGRLDGITYLLEKYDKGGTWPMRTPFSW